MCKKITNPLTIQDLGLHRPSASASFLSEVEVDGPAASKGNPGFADLGKTNGDLLEGPNDGPHDKAGCHLNYNE